MVSWATQRRDEAQDIHGSEHPSQITRASGLVEKVVLFENNDTGARLGHLVGGREADRTSTNNNHIVLVLRGHGDFFGYLCSTTREGCVNCTRNVREYCRWHLSKDLT